VVRRKKGQKVLEYEFFRRWKQEGNGRAAHWIWHGNQMPLAVYGMLRVDGRLRPAHRLGWELHVGPIPEGMVLRNLCGDRMCVRPTHWKLATRKELSQRHRRRRNYDVGEANHGSVLTEAQVREVYLSKCRNTELAKEMGVSATVIGRIKNDKAWVHVTRELSNG
jgi:hypothetical protein